MTAPLSERIRRRVGYGWTEVHDTTAQGWADEAAALEARLAAAEKVVETARDLLTFNCHLVGCTYAAEGRCNCDIDYEVKPAIEAYDATVARSAKA